MGPNGSGKSSLLKLVSGILAPQSGRLSINGRSASQYDPDDLARSTSLLRIDELGGTEPGSAFAHLVEEWRFREGEGTSGRCRFILLDDTSGAAAAGNRTQLRDFLKAVKGEATVFLATHDTSFADLADNALILDEGAMVYFGPVKPAGQTLSPSEENSR